MKVVARAGKRINEERPSDVIVELHMTREKAQELANGGGIGDDYYEMIDETLQEHLKGLHRCQRIRMTPRNQTRFS